MEMEEVFDNEELLLIAQEVSVYVLDKRTDTFKRFDFDWRNDLEDLTKHLNELNLVEETYCDLVELYFETILQSLKDMGDLEQVEYVLNSIENLKYVKINELRKEYL